MAQDKELTCDDYKDYYEQSGALWAEWVTMADTEDAEEWDKAFEWYTAQMQHLNQGFGHPAGRPRKRP